jgi:hypothetical protein
VFIVAPFVLTAIITHRKTREGGVTARRASWVALGVLVAGSTGVHGFMYILASSLKHGRTGGSLLYGFLLLTGPVWLTILGVLGFYIARRIS